MATNARVRFTTKTSSTEAAPPYTPTATGDEDENPIPDLGALGEEIGRHFARCGAGDANQAKETMHRFVRKAELFTKNMQDTYHKLFGDPKDLFCPKHSGEVGLVPAGLCVMWQYITLVVLTHFCCMYCTVVDENVLCIV